jgi:hypothetical protein
MIFTHVAAEDGREAPGPERGAIRHPRFRLVYEGHRYELFDMIEDPSQTREVSGRHPEAFTRLRKEYERIFADSTSGKDFARIPVPIGHPEFPEVLLQAPLADREGGLCFKGQHGWAHDWLVHWTSTADAANWAIEAVQPGLYSPALMYTCPDQALGARMILEVGGQRVEALVAKAHDPAPIPSPDRIPRGEVCEKVWAALEMPPVALETGITNLRVSALSIPGPFALELKAVRLRRAGDGEAGGGHP